MILKFITTIFCTLCLCSSLVNAQKQRKEITEAEFYSTNAAYQKSKEHSFRIDTKKYTYGEDNEISMEEITINEFVPPDSRRWVSVIKDIRGITTLEGIKIGNIIYEKDRVGNWKKRIEKKI